MDKGDYQKFQAMWKSVLGVYGKDIDDLAMGMVFRSLVRFDIEDVQRAIDRHMNDADQGRFIPKPADIVRHIEGDPDSRSLQAWSKVESAIGRIGPYKTVVFDEPEIMVCIEDMGGWIELCGVDDDELPFKRNEFVKRYKGFLNRKPERWPAKLIGKSEAHNSTNEHKSFIDPPTLIGNAQQAHKVLTGGSKSAPKAIQLNDYLGNMKLLSKG